MRRLSILLTVVALASSSEARHVGFGVDAFNRVIPVSASAAAAFSPLSFELDSVTFAEAVDPIRRSIFSGALHVTDEFAAEYQPLARAPFERSATNGCSMSWARVFIVENPRRIDPTFRLTVQDLYGVEVCGAKHPRGVEAWVRTRFAGEMDGWRLPPAPSADAYAFHDLVSLSSRLAPTNGLKRVCPTHTVYRLPLIGGNDFYALVPKAGRPLSSVRTKLTSLTLPEILSMSAAVIDKPVPVRVSLAPLDVVTTNDLAGAFSYFHFPTVALKPFSPGARPALLRQTIRFRLAPPAAPVPDAEPLDGPFVFFIHDPIAKALPVAGIYSRQGQ